MKIVVCVIGVVAMASMAIAQTVAPITSYDIQIFRATDLITGAQFQGQSIALADVVCNLAPTTVSGIVVNPRFAEFADPAIVGRVCRANFSSLFSALPVATGYKATLTAYNGLSSVRSNASGPFDVAPGPPAAPTGVGVRP